VRRRPHLRDHAACGPCAAPRRSGAAREVIDSTLRCDDADAARADDVLNTRARAAGRCRGPLEHAKSATARPIWMRARSFHSVTQPVLTWLVPGGTTPPQVFFDESMTMRTPMYGGQMPGRSRPRLQIGVGGGGLDVTAARGARGVESSTPALRVIDGRCCRRKGEHLWSRRTDRLRSGSA